MSVKTYSKGPLQGEQSSNVRCAVCGAADYSLKWEGPSYRFVRCSGCGVLYQNPQPDLKALSQRYDQEYFQYERENEEAFFSLILQALRDIRFFRDLEPQAGEPGRFLDVGCATGRLLAELKERGWGVEGIEVCKPSADFGRQMHGLTIHTLPLEHARLPAKTYDVVHASHLIEHVTDPGGFIDEAARLLKPAGRLILVTPNRDGFQARLLGERWRSLIPDHVYLFSRSTLRSLLHARGFDIEMVKTWGGLAKGLAPAPLKRIVDRAAKRFSFGDVMVMRARKRAV